MSNENFDWMCSFHSISCLSSMLNNSTFSIQTTNFIYCVRHYSIFYISNQIMPSTWYEYFIFTADAIPWFQIIRVNKSKIHSLFDIFILYLWEMCLHRFQFFYNKFLMHPHWKSTHCHKIKWYKQCVEDAIIPLHNKFSLFI